MITISTIFTVRKAGVYLLSKAVVARYGANYTSQLFRSSNLKHFHSSSCHFDQHSEVVTPGENELKQQKKYSVPQRVRQKLISAEDAVNLVNPGDTVVVSGFVTQGAAEGVLEALGKRFENTGEPGRLTLLFGGGPGDYGERGLSHLAKTTKDGYCMLRRTIGGHYGQVPKVAELVLNETVEAWTLPMGSISRMIRAQATHSPGHITTVGIGTYVDPDIAGGAANKKALESKLHPKLVRKINIAGEETLMYKALPINVAIIRGTTADAMGNITLEHESLLCDQRICAAAAKNSGGIVIAQVKRVAATGSIPSRQVGIPAALVDCVVVIDEEDHKRYHPMSYITSNDPFLTGELRSPASSLEPMPMDLRKIVARRAFFGLRPNKIVNLGIGIPDGIASVAAEEGMLDYITLSTEPGVFGGLPASGHEFGPAYNATSLMEMNQMFDFYDGGGLDMCFLGAAQVSKSGDVNVSRMSGDRLTGPGGFINISQCTRKCCFMLPLTAKGLKVSIPGDGTLKIDKEGQVKKFVPEVFEKTFSGDEAVRRGQEVLYVTERAVFTRTSKSDTLELIEIAPGVDLQKDVLDQMDFVPVIRENLKLMDPRIFMLGKMKVTNEIFGSLEERFQYDATDHTVYVNLWGITLNTEDDVVWFENSMRSILKPIVEQGGPVNMVANYEGFDLGKGLEGFYSDQVAKLQKDFYKSAKRYTGHAFQRAQLKSQLHIDQVNPDEVFDQWDVEGSGYLTAEMLLNGFEKHYHIQLSPAQIKHFKNALGEIRVDRVMFAKELTTILNKDY